MYSLDTSALIDAFQWMPPDIAPGLWTWLHEQGLAGNVRVSEAVYDEISAGDDALKQWLHEHRDSLVEPYSTAVQEGIQNHQGVYARLVDERNQRSLGDPFVVELAYLSSGIVVAHEKLVANGTPMIKIPNACAELGIGHMRFHDFLRAEGVKLRV